MVQSSWCSRVRLGLTYKEICGCSKLRAKFRRFLIPDINLKKRKKSQEFIDIRVYE